MKIIDCDAIDHKARKSRSTGSGIQGILPFRRKREAQEIFISLLSEALDNSFYLLNMLVLPGQGKQNPLLLLGPTGIWAILPSGVAGIYRVNESAFERFDEKSRQFVTIKPNLVLEVCAWAKAVSDSLAGLEMQIPSIEPILFFSDPGAHIDFTHPTSRIVLADGLPRFLTGLFHAPSVLEKDEIRQIIVGLVGEEALDPFHFEQEIKDEYSFRDKPAPEKPTPKPPAAPSRLATMIREEPHIVRQVSRHVPFNLKQWAMLGVLVLLAAIMLVALVFVVLINP
jgi:hypothetical protein